MEYETNTQDAGDLHDIRDSDEIGQHEIQIPDAHFANEAFKHNYDNINGVTDVLAVGDSNEDGTN